MRRSAYVATVRYFIPNLDVRRRLDEAAPSHAEKLGGLPEGLAHEAWPLCRDCGGLMSLIGQFVHHAERLPLGRDERRLYVLMCDNDPGTCETWDADSGANACLVVEPEQIQAEATEVDSPPSAWHEAIITGWIQRDDGLDESLRASFFSDAEYFGSPDRPGLAEQTVDIIPMDTKFGSVPHWVQGSEEGPAGYEFLGQIDCQMRFLDEPHHVEPWMSEGDGSPGSPRYWAEGPNFGDGGIAYLFVDRLSDPPRVKMFWQCF